MRTRFPEGSRAAQSRTPPTARYCDGVSPMISVKRELNEPTGATDGDGGVGDRHPLTQKSLGALRDSSRSPGSSFWNGGTLEAGAAGRPDHAPPDSFSRGSEVIRRAPDPAPPGNFS